MKVLCIKLPFNFTQAYVVGLIYDAVVYKDKNSNWRVSKEGGWGLYMDDSTFKKCFKEMP